MEYQVPQFIEVENKIIGPLTFRQFVYLAGAGGLVIVFFSYFPFVAALLLSVPAVALGGALAFYKVNGKPFISILEAGFNFYSGSKLFLWRHEDKPEAARKPEGSTTAASEGPRRDMTATYGASNPSSGPRLTRDRLSELAWSLDAGGKGSDSTRS